MFEEREHTGLKERRMPRVAEEDAGPYRLRGIIYPQPEQDPEYMGPHLREDEIPDLAKRLIGEPVNFEHDPHKQVGVIENISRSSGGEVVGHLRVDDWRPYGKDVIKGLKTNEINGLSLGMNFDVTEDYEVFNAFDPFEVSVVEKGEIEKTHILSHGDKKQRYLNFWGSHSLRGDTQDPPSSSHTWIKAPIPSSQGSTNSKPRMDQTAAPASGEDIVARLQQQLNEARAAHAAEATRANEAEKMVKATQKEKFNAFMQDFEQDAVELFKDEKEIEEFGEQMEDQFLKKSKVGYVFLSSINKKYKDAVTEKDAAVAKMKDMEAKHQEALVKKEAVKAASRIVTEKPEDRRQPVADSLYPESSTRFESVNRMKILASAKTKATPEGEAPVSDGGEAKRRKISWGSVQRNPLVDPATVKGAPAAARPVEEEELV